MIHLLILLFASSVSFTQTKLNEDEYKVCIRKDSFTVFEYPDSKSPPYNFNIIHPGMIVVPLAGGQFVAGLDKWFFSPVNKVESVANFAGKKGFGVIRWKEDKQIFLFYTNQNDTTPQFTAELPAGKWGIEVKGDRFLIYGVGFGKWQIWELYNSNELRRVYYSLDPIQDVCIIEEGVLVASGKNIDLYTKSDKKSLLSLDNYVDGIAIGKNETIYVSNETGVIMLNINGEKNIITHFIHGPLKVLDNHLYILYRENNQVIKIPL